MTKRLLSIWITYKETDPQQNQSPNYMNKAQLIEKIASDADISKKQACATMDALTDIITDILVKGGKINMIGLGIFSVYKRPARKGRNPQNGATIVIREQRMVRFRMGPELTDRLNSIPSNRTLVDSRSLSTQ